MAFSFARTVTQIALDTMVSMFNLSLHADREDLRWSVPTTSIDFNCVEPQSGLSSYVISPGKVLWTYEIKVWRTFDRLHLPPGGGFDQLFCPRGWKFFFKEKFKIPTSWPTPLPPPGLTLIGGITSEGFLCLYSFIYSSCCYHIFFFWILRVSLAVYGIQNWTKLLLAVEMVPQRFISIPKRATSECISCFLKGSGFSFPSNDESFRFLVFLFVCIFTREIVRISLCRRLLRCTLLRQMREYSHQKTYSGVKRMLWKLKLLENVYKHRLEWNSKTT